MAGLSKHDAKDPFLRAFHGIIPYSLSPDFEAWRENIQKNIATVFGENSQPASKFSHAITTIRDGDMTGEAAEAAIKRVLEQMFVGIDTYWPDEGHVPMLPTNQVFVVHGRDSKAEDKVSDFLSNLQLKPIILQYQPNAGRTIIEKFEKYAHVSFAVVLFTPDDVGRLANDRTSLAFRARQNVIFELGYFIGNLGRARVCVLHKGEVEIPSDYAGVLYIPLDDDDHWEIQFKRELENAGII